MTAHPQKRMSLAKWKARILFENGGVCPVCLEQVTDLNGARVGRKLESGRHERSNLHIIHPWCAINGGDNG